MSTTSYTLGRLTKCLNSHIVTYQTVVEIEVALGIDNAFPAPKNVVDLLLKLLPFLVEATPKAQEWITALQEISTSDEASKWLLIAPSGPDTNPLNRNFTQYPVCAYLLQSSHHQTISQSDGIKLVFLYAVLNNPYEHGLTSHANDLRISTRRRSVELQLLNSLPQLESEFFHYYQSLRDLVKKLISSHSGSVLLSSLRTLLQLAPVKKPAHIIQPKPQGKTLPASTGIENLHITPAGKIVTFVTQEGNAAEGEPPEFDDIVTTLLDLDDSLTDIEPELLSPSLIITAATEVQARKSEYWLRRHHRLVPTDYGRLTFTERQHLAAYIKIDILSSDTEQRIAAGLIGTMYVTGLTLDVLLQTSIGPDKVLSKSGLYIRKIQRPAGAFTPLKGQLADLQPLATKLLLTLPDPLGNWISSLCTFEAALLCERLHMKPDAVAVLVKNSLKNLRKNTNLHRIRLERIPAALALETTLTFQDPLITYLLASSDLQAPPKLAYYAAYPTKMLIESYSVVTERMLNP